MADETLSNEQREHRSGEYRGPQSFNGANGAADPASERVALGQPAATNDVAPDTGSHRAHSPTALVRQLLGDAALLFRKEIALAASEVSESIDSAKTGAISMVSGGAVLYAGFLFLLGGAAIALATAVPAWAAWLIVGAATALVGAIMVRTGKSRVSTNSFAPNRTVDALRKDSVAIRRQM